MSGSLKSYEWKFKNRINASSLKTKSSTTGKSHQPEGWRKHIYSHWMVTSCLEGKSRIPQ